MPENQENDSRGGLNGSDRADGKISTRIKSDTDSEKEGSILAMQTVERGDRRVDWKIGYKDGIFSEANDLYYKGDLLYQEELIQMPENAASGKFDSDGNFQPLQETNIRDDGEMEREYGESEDGTEWAITYLQRSGPSPQDILNEIWPQMMEQYGDKN